MTTTSRSVPARPQLTVAMIVRNEIDVIGASLASIQSIADEVVVVDTGSSDCTGEVARQMGARVVYAPWSDDFSAARNRCLELANGQWILWVEAGERLDPATAPALRHFVTHQAAANRAYLITVEMPAKGPDGLVEQSLQLRLAPRRHELRYEGRVRETMRPSIDAAGVQVEVAPGRLIRDPRENDLQYKSLCATRDRELARLEAEEQGGYSPRLWLAQGDADLAEEKRDAARSSYLQAIAASPKGSTMMLEAYYGLLATLEGGDHPALQLSAAVEALETFPLDGQLLIAMGHYLQANQRMDLAMRAFELAVRHGQVDLETWHLRDLAEVATSCYALALQVQGQDDDAYQALQDGLRHNQDSTRIRNHLIDLLVKRGETEEAVQLAAQLPMTPAQRAALADAIRGAGLAQAGRSTQALGYLQSALVQGCKHPICFRWLLLTLSSQGRAAAAETVARRWLQIEPENAEARAFLAAATQTSHDTSHPLPPRVPLLLRQPGRLYRIDPPETFVALPTMWPIITQATASRH